MLHQSGMKWKPVESRDQRKFLHPLRKHRSERSRSFGEGLGDDWRLTTREISPFTPHNFVVGFCGFGFSANTRALSLYWVPKVFFNYNLKNTFIYLRISAWINYNKKSAFTLDVRDSSVESPNTMLHLGLTPAYHEHFMLSINSLTIKLSPI
jgi:hypothetical protein